MRQQGGASGIPVAFFVGEEGGEDRGVRINDAVGNEPTAFLPQLLFLCGLEAELPEVGIGHRTTQLMVILATIERPVHVPT